MEALLSSPRDVGGLVGLMQRIVHGGLAA